MTDERFSRTRPVLGESGMDALSRAKVIVFGAGGVGGAAIEALARAGVGTLHVVDPDTVSVSNINRQLLAADSTVGLPKVEAAKRRVFDIAPSCHFTGHEHFYTPEDRGGIELWDFDYIIDAIDDLPEDEKKKRFNPFLLLFDGRIDDTQRQDIHDALLSCLSDLETAFDLINDTASPDRREVLKNILYLGMPATVRQVLYGKTESNKEDFSE